LVKNILFLVNRNLYYRHYGPFIDYFLNLGHNLNLLHDYSHARDGVKGSYFPALNSVPDFKGKISFYGIYKTKNDIISFIKENSIDFVFSLNSYNYYDIDKVSIEPSKWVCLQHWADNFQHGPIEPFSCDHFLSYSKYWWDSFIRSDYHKDAYKLKPNIHHIGHPLNYLIDKLDRDYIKKKYNIPLDKKVLTYLPIGPAPMYIFQTVYQKLWLVYRYSSNVYKQKIKYFMSLINPFLFMKKEELVDEKRIITSIANFCSNNDFISIAKTRFKSNHSNFFYENLDHVFYDETFYPPTITELLFISDITINHFSMATFESIAMKSFTININLEPVFENFTYALRALFDRKWIDDFTIDGLGSIMSGNHFIQEFGSSDYKEFQIKNNFYDDFMLKYFSGTDPQNFYNTLDKLVNGDFDDVK